MELMNDGVNTFWRVIVQIEKSGFLAQPREPTTGTVLIIPMRTGNILWVKMFEWEMVIQSPMKGYFRKS